MSNKGRGVVSDSLAMIILCETMQWDYYTYLKQPNWFLSSLRKKMNIDALYQDQQNRMAKRKR